MFENIISQDAVSLLKKDLEKKCFPGAGEVDLAQKRL